MKRFADMAELADAPDLGSGVYDVQVQVLLSALDRGPGTAENTRQLPADKQYHRMYLNKYGGTNRGQTINSNMRCEANGIFRYMYFAFFIIKWNRNKNVKQIS